MRLSVAEKEGKKREKKKPMEYNERMKLSINAMMLDNWVRRDTCSRIRIYGINDR